MKKFLLSFIILFIGINCTFASHNRAGEITYKWISGYTYKITITTYTKESSTDADKCDLSIHFGDGDTATFVRNNGPTGTICGSGVGAGISLGSDTKKNTYEGIHTYPGPGNYSITMDNPNRNSSICNIPNSLQTSFSLITQLVINPFLYQNSSPILLNPPLDQGCVGQCFEHNPGAYDAEGDSLYYTLTQCYANGAPIPGFTFPPNMTTNSIDHHTGDLVWCAPNMQCEYNVAIKIEEYKLVLGTNVRVFVGSILRDMQIVIATCANTPPVLTDLKDTCIQAGTLLQFNVIATDAQVSPNIVTLSSTGGPYVLNPAAVFNATGTNPVNGTFSWTPGCSAIKLLPYLVTFKAEDNDGAGTGASPMVNFESMFIRVVSPPPINLTAVPSGSSIILNWSPPTCGATGGSNPIKKYFIYRKESCDPWIHSACETGVPSYTGYTSIDTVLAPITTSIDNNNGAGLLHGIDYSYIIVAYFSDGSQSYASTNICAQLVRDVPIITNVSVLSTSNSTGTIWTHWVKPFAVAPNLDTIANPGPYEYRLMQSQGQSGVFNQVSSYTYPAYWNLTDTGFVSSGLNTQDFPYTYRVDFYSNGIFKGSTHTASSVFLNSAPSGNQITLNWTESVPWINNQYFIYKEVPTGSATFILIDSTILHRYTDTALVNGRNYCYKVQSRGEYSDPALPRPLFNMSQIKCETPVDKVPPCQPNFTVTPDCGITQNILSWTNPNTYCSTDAIQYNVYFAQTTDGTLQLIYSTTDMNATTFTHVDNFSGIPSIAGCYAVTAVDTFANESVIVNKICVDNCPIYELPNVFTPNGDNVNDLFIPLPYRYVKDVDMKIFDRWGLEMFATNDPDILWDGKNKDTKVPCTDGIYFYVCVVNEIHVDGIIPKVLKGFVQLINPKNGPTN